MNASNNLIFYAILKNSLESVKDYINQGIDVNKPINAIRNCLRFGTSHALSVCESISPFHVAVLHYLFSLNHAESASVLDYMLNNGGDVASNININYYASTMGSYTPYSGDIFGLILVSAYASNVD